MNELNNSLPTREKKEPLTTNSPAEVDIHKIERARIVLGELVAAELSEPQQLDDEQSI